MSSRLGNDNYNRPKKTLQEKLTKEEQEEKLIGYQQIDGIDDLKELPLGTEIRYFIYSKIGSKVIKKFRLGGRLLNKDNADKYIVLATGLPPSQKTWSVQVNDAEIYFKQKVEDVIKEQSVKKEEVNKLMKDNERLMEELLKLRDDYKNLKEERNKAILNYNLLVDKYQKLKKK